MTIQENSIIQPIPSEELIKEKEKRWRITLPEDYKDFILKYNGCIPNEKTFELEGRDYVVTRFLCILKDVKDNQNGWYDISVVESQLGERLTENEDLIGIEVLPIAELFAGDYLCLDFKNVMDSPTVCVWNHEESGDFDPSTYKVADSFSKFVEMLK